MPVIKTKAIVFSAIKYGDTSLIVKCFTKQEGIKSYLVRGVLTSKKGKLKPAYFQPLTQLELTANHNNKGALNAIKEAQVIYPFETIYTSIIKQSIVLFLSEVLSGIIREEEKNETLYSYIETAIIWLDTHTDVANFHLLFLLNLSYFLGFYPDTSEKDKQGFNLLEGCFTDNQHDKLTIYDNDLKAFKKLLDINFDTISEVSFNKRERQSILQTIISYFELHLSGFRSPKSLNILEAVFN